MASSSNQSLGLEESYAKLTLDDEEEGGLVFDDIGGEEDSVGFQWCLVGHFLTDRPINFAAMKNTLASIWRPMKRVCIKDLSLLLFLFQLFNELDFERVIKRGPWTFNQHLLITSRLKIGDNPSQVPLDLAASWIQLHEVPYGFKSEKVEKDIGNYLGLFIESDPNNFGGIWRNYMRIRVSFDVWKPLKKRMRIKKASGEWTWVTFKYERLPTFCFLFFFSID
ncbi:hypothetical protein CRYUN_Cryun35bG0090100 [Craigia yunnanensis]